MSRDWLPVPNVAEALGLPSRDIAAMILSGELHGERCPSGICSWHVTEESVEEYIAQRLPAVAS